MKPYKHLLDKSQEPRKPVRKEVIKIQNERAVIDVESAEEARRPQSEKGMAGEKDQKAVNGSKE